MKYFCKESPKAKVDFSFILKLEDFRLEITGDTVLNISARHFVDEDFDEGLEKHNHHSGELKQRDLTTLNIDLEQTGVGGINSWGTWPLKQYRLEYKDYSYSFIIKPIE